MIFNEIGVCYIFRSVNINVKDGCRKSNVNEYTKKCGEPVIIFHVFLIVFLIFWTSGKGMIGVTEPRRVAAISMSKRVAEEMGLSSR